MRTTSKHGWGNSVRGVYANKAMTAVDQSSCEGCPYDKGEGKEKCWSKNYKGCTATVTYETKSRLR